MATEVFMIRKFFIIAIISLLSYSVANENSKDIWWGNLFVRTTHGNVSIGVGLNPENLTISHVDHAGRVYEIGTVNTVSLGFTAKAQRFATGEVYDSTGLYWSCFDSSDGINKTYVCEVENNGVDIAVLKVIKNN
jgi:hypothetical protein